MLIFFNTLRQTYPYSIMKQIKSTLLILTLCVFVFSSCKKSSKDSPSSDISISLKFNGTAKSSATPIASYYPGEKTLQIAGSFNGKEALSLMIENIKVGTFNLPSDDVLATYTTNISDFSTTYFGSTGSVTITSFTDSAVSGTFQFSGTNTSNAAGTVTEGKFNAKIIKVQQQ